jgi:protein-L-isoaspartate(D-aspartate) O-methyltransferase
MMKRDYDYERKRMVDHHLKARGITDERVLRVMNTLPRELFVSSTSQFMAYNDFPIPIGKGQTISQPYIVALMTQLLRLSGDEKVLEIGTGSGYQTAILSHLARKVVSVEREKELALQAQKRLESMGYQNVKVITGDGSEGYIYGAPYDRILLTAAAEKVPKPLLEQLNIGGVLVGPFGGRAVQTIKVIEKKEVDGELRLIEKKSVDCRFVPLKGKYGW